MKIKQWIGMALTAIVGIYAHTANAVLIFSVDLDPNTAGIQDMLTVTEGDVFTVDFTVTGDGVSFFEEFVFDILYNDAGAVLGSGPTGPRAGSIASIAHAPNGARDVFSGNPVSPGSPLSFSLFPPLPPPPGFANQSGQVGIFTFPLFQSAIRTVPGLPLTLILGETVDLFSLDFVASAVGTSTITGQRNPPIFGLFPVPFDIASGQVTVQSAASVPEPSTILLFSLGILGLIGYARQQQKLTQ